MYGGSGGLGNVTQKFRNSYCAICHDIKDLYCSSTATTSAFNTSNMNEILLNELIRKSTSSVQQQISPVLRANKLSLSKLEITVGEHFRPVVYPFTTDLNLCVKYGSVDPTLNWQVCKNHMLTASTVDESSDFVLISSKIYTCQLYSHNTYLETSDIVIGVFSFLVVLGYTFHFFYKGKRSTTGYFVISSLMTAIIAQIFYLLVNSTGLTCRVASCFQIYFFLSLHTWTTAICVWILKGIVNTQPVRHRSNRTYLYYASFAWLTPLLNVALALILDAVKFEKLYPVFIDGLCFIGSQQTRYLLVLAPIYIMTALAIILLIIASVKVFKSGSNLTHTRKHKTRKKIIAIVKLKVLFGLHWILAPFLELEFQYQLSIYRALKFFIAAQGTLVILSQTITTDSIRKMKTEVKKFYVRANSSDDSLTAMTNLTDALAQRS